MLQKVPCAPGVLGSELRLPRRVCFFVTTLALLIHEDGRLAMDDERDAAAKGGFLAGT
jgi:type VI protein secretion system component VasK